MTLLNLYQLFEKNGMAHLVPWEAYRLDNGLVVKIDVGADPRYPFKVGDQIEFISHSRYNEKGRLYILNHNPEIVERYPERVIGVQNAGAVHEKYRANIIEKINLYKVIDLSRDDIDFELLNFTLNGMPLFAEVLVYMMQQINELRRSTDATKNNRSR